MIIILWKINSEDILKVDKLKILPKQFIPINEIENTPLNHVLKNNEENGSYVFEFFFRRKKYLKLSY